MNSKDLFLRNTELVKKCLAMVKSDEFDALVTFSRAEFAEKNVSREGSIAVNLFVQTMKGLPEDKIESQTWEEATSGMTLEHDIESHIRKNKEPQDNKSQPAK